MTELTVNSMESKITVGINKDAVIKAVGTKKGDSVYNTVSLYFDEILSEAKKITDARAYYEFSDDKIYAAVTAGKEISDYSKSLFDKGEAVKGLIADAIADEYVFAADKELSEIIKKECAKRNLGIKARLEAPKDFPLTEQRVILQKASASTITLTDAFMLSPAKSMAYILRLTNDKSIFNAQHDCSRCTAKDCPRRSKAFVNTKIITNYAYFKSPSDKNLVAADIGTTTIALENTRTGKTYKTLNPQRRFGADVLSRIEAANRGRGEEMTAAVRYALKKGIDFVTEGKRAEKIIIAANTAMVHLLMGYDCASLGVYPFKSDHLATFDTTIFDTPATVLGGISAFVGGDIVSGLYMTDFDLCGKVNLFIDLGTNGEMAIGNKDKIIVTSTAAGPAFEGGRLSCEVKGTDVISITAKMLNDGIIDATGKLSDEYFDKGYKPSDNVTVTQRDIREIQMAKSAVRGGIECLINAYGVTYHDIDKVYLAGGMGYYLNPADSAKIGLIPPELTDKTVAVGNSSLGGAVKYAIENESERIRNIQNISKMFPLANHKDFDRLYIENMNF